MIKENPYKKQTQQVHQLENELIQVVRKHPGFKASFNAFVPGEYGLSKVHCLTVRKTSRPWILGKRVLRVNFFDELNDRPMGNVDVYDETGFNLAQEIGSRLGVSVQDEIFPNYFTGPGRWYTLALVGCGITITIIAIWRIAFW